MYEGITTSEQEAIQDSHYLCLFQGSLVRHAHRPSKAVGKLAGPEQSMRSQEP